MDRRQRSQKGRDLGVAVEDLKGPTKEQVRKDQQMAIKMAADYTEVDLSTPDLERILQGDRDGGSDSSDMAPELVPDTLASSQGIL